MWKDCAKYVKAISPIKYLKLAKTSKQKNLLFYVFITQIYYTK